MRFGSLSPIIATIGILALYWVVPASGGDTPIDVRVQVEVAPTRAPRGTVVELAITIHMPPGWIAFDVVQVPESVMPTQINLDRSDELVPLESFQAAGVLQRPEPVFGNRLMRYFRASPIFRRPILIAAEALPGEHAIRGQMDFQVCNGASGRCYIIRKHPFEVPLTVTDQDSASASSGPPHVAADATPAPASLGLTPPTTATASSESPPVAERESSPSEEAVSQGDLLTDETAEPSAATPKRIEPVTIVLGVTDLDRAFEVKPPPASDNWWVPGTLLVVGLGLFLRLRSTRKAAVSHWLGLLKLRI